MLVDFRENHSCEDLVNILGLISEQTDEWNTTMYVTFIDFKKALDSIRQKYLWHVLQQYGIPEKKEIYCKLLQYTVQCNKRVFVSNTYFSQ
jgi:hypothetical protein